MGQGISWNELLARYETAQRAAGRSAGTIRLHRHYLTQLRALQPGPLRVDVGQLQDFLARPDWAPETRKSARAAVRGFYRWAHGAGLLVEDPAAGLEPVRVPVAIPRPTPEHLVRQLLRAPDERLAFMGMLMAFAGLRAGEVARVHRRDYLGDYLGGSLIVVGKGGKAREVPIVDERLARLLDDVEGWAFPNGLGSHLSAGHVSRLMSAALPERWTGHTLRHRCASIAYAATRDLLAVGAVLGHSRPETTQRYVRMPDDALVSVARAASVA